MCEPPIGIFYAFWFGSVILASSLLLLFAHKKKAENQEWFKKNRIWFIPVFVLTQFIVFAIVLVLAVYIQDKTNLFC